MDEKRKSWLLTGLLANCAVWGAVLAVVGRVYGKWSTALEVALWLLVLAGGVPLVVGLILLRRR